MEQRYKRWTKKIVEWRHTTGPVNINETYVTNSSSKWHHRAMPTHMAKNEIQYANIPDSHPSAFQGQVARQIFITASAYRTDIKSGYLGIIALFSTTRQEIYDINHGRMDKKNASYYGRTMAGLPKRFAGLLCNPFRDAPCTGRFFKGLCK